MVCNKLIKEAFEGIEFRYKLDDTLTDLGEQKFTARQLEGYLTGKGVSPKEIKQSGLLKGFESDNRAIPASEWLSRSGSQRLSTTTLQGGKYGSANFDNISLGTKGVDNETYKETLTGIASPKTNMPNEPHFNNQLPNVPNPKEIHAKEAVDKYIAKEQSNGRVFIDILNDTEYKKLSSELKSASLIPDKSQSLLGWRRTHVDDINGKKTLVLNEFQSDWAQTERAGSGTFESNSGKVADFPMSELKHHQFQIVGAIDDAIKQGIDTVAIPIQRENELAGSAGVTKFYESLNTKILPDIRKKLEKQGLKISVSKKPYKSSSSSSSSIDVDQNLLNKWEDIDDKFYGKQAPETIKALKEIQDSTWFDSFYNHNEYPYEYKIDELIKKHEPDSILSDILVGLRRFKKSIGTNNELWTLTIDELPNTKVKWDVYGLIGSLGLAGYVNKEGEQ